MPPCLQRGTRVMRAGAHREHQRGNAMNAVTSPALFDAQFMRETLLSERPRATMLASVAAVIGLTLFLLSRLDASEFLTALRQTKTDYPMLGLRHPLGRLIHHHRRAP